MTQTAGPTSPAIESDLATYRGEVTGYCYRMLGSVHDAEDAVQETMVRAWRAMDSFGGRSSVRSWLYRIATNVCLDAIASRKRRATPLEMGGPSAPVQSSLGDPRPHEEWLEPLPWRGVAPSISDPAEQAAERDNVRLAFVAALQPATREPLDPLDAEQQVLLRRYVQAFENYDIDAFVALLHEDATQSRPPFALWLQGAQDLGDWMLGPGIGCRGSRVLRASDANGCPAFAQYKPAADGDGFEPWGLHVLEITGGRIAGITSFLDTRLFARFGMPDRLEADGR